MQSTHALALALVCSTLGSKIAAQSTAVVPAGNYGNEGHTYTGLPFRDQNMILQQWMPPADIGIPHNSRIVGIAFVREAVSAAGTPSNPEYLKSIAWTLDRVEIRVAAGAATFTQNTVTNYDAGAIPAANFSQANFAIPAYQSPAATGPAVDLVRIPLTTATRYDATKPLLIEVRNISNTQLNRNPAPGTYVLCDRSYPTGSEALRGWGCPNNSSAVPTFYLVLGRFEVGQTTMATLIYSSATMGAWAMLLGFQFNTVLGQPPGVPINSLPGLGGVGPLCRLWVDPYVAIAGNGSLPLTFVLPIPASAPLGLPVGMQPVFVDSNAPGSLTVGPGTYAYVRTAGFTNATWLTLFAGSGDTSAAAVPQPMLNTYPMQSYAITLKLIYS